MKKIVINTDWGGFDLSNEAIRRYADLKGIKLLVVDNEFGGTDYYVDGIKDDEHYFWHMDIDRDDPALVQVVEELQEKSEGSYASLKVVEIPDDVDWTIQEHDGREWVAETHRKWY